MQIAHSALLNATRQLSQLGMMPSASGNVSVRDADGFLITPSGADAAKLQAEHLVHMTLEGEYQNLIKPSSEWRFHRDIYACRPEIHAVVHSHSMFATTLACLNMSLPAFHYMIAVAGGDDVRCTPYRLFGTQALSDVALLALENRYACLLGNHGLIAIGRNAEHAVNIAHEVETLCEQYWRALQVGEPNLLTAEQMQEVFEQFKGYSRWSDSK